MSFFEKVDKIRERPERERRRLAMVWTGALMVPVILFWVLTKALPGINDNGLKKEPTKETSGLGASLLSVWGEVKEGTLIIKGEIDNIRGVGKVEEQ